jgi:hypothetical protein
LYLQLELLLYRACKGTDEKTTFSPLKVSFFEKSGRTSFQVGDTAIFVNTTAQSNQGRNDLDKYQFEWQVNGVLANYEISTELVLPITSEYSTYSSIVVTLLARLSDDNPFINSSSLDIKVLCQYAPQIPKSDYIRYNGTLEVNREIGFNPPVSVKPNWELYWDFGDGTTSRDRTPKHSYQKRK